MDHIPNSDDFFEEEKPAKEKEEIFNKLLAVKKSIEQKRMSTNDFQPITTRQRPNKINTTNTKLVKKDTPKPSTVQIITPTTKSKSNKQRTIENKKTINKPKKAAQKRSSKVLTPTPLLKDKAPITKKLIAIKKDASKKPKKTIEQSAPKKEKQQQGFGDYKKVSKPLTNKLPEDNKKTPVAKISSEPSPTEAMTTLDNNASASTYGRGTETTGTHVRDSPYTEKEIPVDGKNLIPRSQEVHEILSYVPNWMVRWGNTVIFLLIIGILVMSYYIKYPDVVKGIITINSAYPPIPLVSKATGSLKLLKQDKDLVQPEEVIGVIKNTANYEDVQQLKKELIGFQDKLEKGWNFSYYELPKGLQLGELQGAYSNLFIKLKENKIQHKSNSNNKTRKQNINQQLQELETIKRAKEKSLSIKYQEYLKAKNLLETRYQVLHKKGSISAEQLNAKESEVRNLLDFYQNDRMGFNEIKKRILDLGSSKVELDFQKEDQQILSQSSLLTAYESLKNSIHNWEATYLLKAPIAGTLNFIQFTKNNMYLQQSQTLANISPSLNETDTSSVMIGELLMPTIGAGKVAIGQTVNVALNDYPKKQYGIVEGKIESIADLSIPIPDAQGMAGYKVVVSFPKGLENTMKKEIIFKHNMQGNAEIITADIRLIERFFHELRDLFGTN